MKKSTFIATLLVNLRSGIESAQAEEIVFREFVAHFPNENFYAWNTELDDDLCARELRAAGTPSHINVISAIKELWDM